MTEHAAWRNEALARSVRHASAPQMKEHWRDAYTRAEREALVVMAVLGAALVAACSVAVLIAWWVA